jgi:FtsH-binding integral membrane protein
MNKTFPTSISEDLLNAKSTLSERAFYFVIGCMVIIGLAGMGYTAKWAVENNLILSWWQLILVICIPFLGIFIASNTDDPLNSFMGYLMIVLPFGILLGPLLVKYDQAVVVRAAMLTGGITLLMTFASMTRPDWFANMGGALFTALICLIFIRILQIFIPILQQLKSIDYLAAGLFSLYIGYDMYRAQKVVRTVGSAINIAISLYLDIINLFSIILRIKK